MGLGDAFIRGMLSALRNKLLWDLRRKARVAVAEAAMVMGVADDYGDLEYGQVFLQVSDEVLVLFLMRVRYSLQFSASSCPRAKVVKLGYAEKPEDAGQTRGSVWFALLHIESFCNEVVVTRALAAGLLQNTGEPIPVLGRVVIAKNPAFHPGDVRVFEAVRAPHLTHLVDVVVFPVKGDRPHPNELSGSGVCFIIKERARAQCCWLMMTRGVFFL
jgi:hypothetical protein